MSVFGLIGGSPERSLSPLIHERLGTADYRVFPMETKEQVISFLHRRDLGGVNITMPHKLTAAACCDRLTAGAARAGCVNTVIPLPDGSLLGANTDICGLRYAAMTAGITLRGAKVLILGSGGGARAAKAMAEQAQAARIVLISRRGEDNYANISRYADSEVLINATPVGMYPHNAACPVDIDIFPRLRGVIDLIYDPLRTALILQAEDKGIACAGGLPMLIAQAKAASALFHRQSESEPRLRFPDAEIEKLTADITKAVANIILIGMPGSGKTVIGKELAALSGRPFADTDRLIEDSQGVTCREIILKQGEAVFRQKEAAVVAAVARERGLVIATGGGTVKTAASRLALRQNGSIYQICRDNHLLAKEGRPLSTGDMAALAAQRQPIYDSLCQMKIENNASPRNAAERIWRDYENSGDKRP